MWGGGGGEGFFRDYVGIFSGLLQDYFRGTRLEACEVNAEFRPVLENILE